MQMSHSRNHAETHSQTLYSQSLNLSFPSNPSLQNSGYPEKDKAERISESEGMEDIRTMPSKSTKSKQYKITIYL